MQMDHAMVMIPTVHIHKAAPPSPLFLSLSLSLSVSSLPSSHLAVPVKEHALVRFHNLIPKVPLPKHLRGVLCDLKQRRETTCPVV